MSYHGNVYCTALSGMPLLQEAQRVRTDATGSGGILNEQASKADSNELVLVIMLQKLFPIGSFSLETF